MSEPSASEVQSTCLRDVAMMFDDLGRQINSTNPGSVFNALTQVAVQRVPGTNAASITVYRHGQFKTVSATDDRARQADAIQYELGSGPCVDAIVEETLYRPVDLRQDSRWPEYGTRVHKEFGWTSMLSFRLFPELATVKLIAGLNLYAERPHAFVGSATRVGLLLATHGAMAVAADVNRDQAENLKRALGNSREIGVAVGVLMARHQHTREHAFDLLRVASQHLNRKLREIAVEVGDTGMLPEGLVAGWTHPPHLGRRGQRLEEN
ncbi:MAG TPA: GAF and ANTAR domain-containing protein [Pseudonocardiaceae bacterium]|jgi:hypothetical protein